MLFSRPFRLPRFARSGITSARRVLVQHIEIELGIGDVVQIGESFYTVLDIEHGEVTFRVDPADPLDGINELTVGSRAAK